MPHQSPTHFPYPAIKPLISHAAEKAPRPPSQLPPLLPPACLDGSSACTHKVQKFRRNLSIRIFLDLSQRFCVHTGSRQRTHFIFFLCHIVFEQRAAHTAHFIYIYVVPKPACLKIYCASRTFTSLLYIYIYICSWHSEFGTGWLFWR